MSLTIVAPAATAWRTTAALVVSTEIGTSIRPARAAITEPIRRHSSSADTGVKPGLVDSPPMSMIAAPFGHHRLGARDGRRDDVEPASVRKAVGCDVEDAHDQEVAARPGEEISRVLRSAREIEGGQAARSLMEVG